MLGTFNWYTQTTNTQNTARKWAEEQVNMFGIPISYYPVDTEVYQGLNDAVSFKGEDTLIKYLGPIDVKCVITTTPEAQKIWEAMGFFSTDSITISMPKEMLITSIGRRPFPRDRFVVPYNNTQYEVTDVFEQPPKVFYNIVFLELQAKKLIEGFEDSSLLHQSMSLDQITGGDAISAIVEGLTTMHNMSASQELTGTLSMSALYPERTIWGGW